MKKICIILLLAISVSATAQTKRERRIKYIFKELKLDAKAQVKVKDFVEAYLKELSDNKKAHDALKDKYKAADDAGKLTDAQADELMVSKLRKDEKDIEIRRKYYQRFKGALGAMRARKIIQLSNDKLEK